MARNRPTPSAAAAPASSHRKALAKRMQPDGCGGERLLDDASQAAQSGACVSATSEQPALVRLTAR